MVLAEEWPSWLWFLDTVKWRHVTALVKDRLRFKHLWDCEHNSVTFGQWSRIYSEVNKIVARPFFLYFADQ